MTDAFNGKDGKRQFVVLVNQGEDAFSPAAARALARLATIAYCGREA